jgi:hypothetical protein
MTKPSTGVPHSSKVPSVSGGLRRTNWP